MRYITTLLAIFIASGTLAGCKESREEMVDRLFPSSEAVQGTEQFYKIVATEYPHVAPDKAKQVIAKHFQANESFNRELKQKQWSEQYWSDEELEVAARMIHDPLNAVTIAGSEDKARLISIKIYETQQKTATPEVREKVSVELEKLNEKLRALESEADS